MLDHAPETDSSESIYTRIETATDAWFARAENKVRHSARRLLIVLILLSVIISILACIVISGIGVGVWEVNGEAQASRHVSPIQATETYGAEQFHIQLTAQAQEITP